MFRRARFLPVLVLVAVTLLGAGCTKLGTGGDSGRKWSTVTYSVTGSGQADIQYAATATSKMTSSVGATLPFSITVRTVDHSRTVYTVIARHGTGPLHCKIKVNTVVVTEKSVAAGRPLTCSYVK